MVKELKPTKADMKQFEIDKKQNELIKKQKEAIEYVKDQLRVINKKVKKIYTIWDGFFKTLGVVVSLALAIFVTAIAKNIYYKAIVENGCWKFVAVCLFVVLFLVIVVAGVMFTWWLVGKCLVQD